MKAEKRHQLQRNALADRMGRLFETMKSSPRSSSTLVWAFIIVTLATFEQSAQAVPGAVSIGCDAGYHSTWLEHAMSLSEQTVDPGGRGRARLGERADVPRTHQR